MKRAKNFFLLLLTIPILGLANLQDGISKSVDEIVNSVSSQVFKEHDLQLIGTGGEMSDGIETIHLYFKGGNVNDIMEARSLEVSLIEKLCKAVNANPKIQKYLVEYPFPPHRAEIMLSLRSSKNETKEGPVTVFQTRGKIFYNYDDQTTDNLITRFEEPYEEAYKIVMKN